MATPPADFPDSDDATTETETVSFNSDEDTEEKAVQFASFLPDNAAAVHLLETVQASSSSPACLISDEDTIAYLLSLPPLSDIPDGDEALASANGRWRIGAGPSQRLIEKGVACAKIDILLCPLGNTPGTKRARESIKSAHAVLFFHPESGVLVLRNVCSKPIIYQNGDADGEDLTIYGGVKGRDSCVLFRERNCLQFGDYHFVLEFNLDPLNHDRFREQRDAILSFSHGRPSRHLALVPTEEHIRCWDIRIHHLLSYGAHGSQVYCGVQLHTGKPVAVKKMRYKRDSQHRIRKELEVASLFSDSDSGVHGLIASWCEHGDSPPCRLDKCVSKEDHEDVYYSMPLAEYDFESMPWAQLDFVERLGYFYQTLSGLIKLHKKEIYHGRIRPISLLIMPETSPLPTERESSALKPSHHLPAKAVISPAVSPKPYGKPSHPECWVAPEVYTSTAETPCTTKMDIWALAASWLPAFVVVPSNVKINQRTYRVMIKTVEDQHQKAKITGAFRNLLLKMLAWDPEERPTGEEALAHDAWAPFLMQKELHGERMRRERNKRIQDAKLGAIEGVKKVRVLSPEVED
ncbi:putative serine threonine protein kinase [Podospora fimiseda]|uniref:Serine threonine protein kinase n=1 Tax=Podospora fimiseda TaxID=252190 RepID=A0AAN7BXW2_9PEZI|nr:putative serine threonine protein kinase [Podospora fimiseda]